MSELNAIDKLIYASLESGECGGRRAASKEEQDAYEAAERARRLAELSVVPVTTQENPEHPWRDVQIMNTVYTIVALPFKPVTAVVKAMHSRRKISG